MGSPRGSRQVTSECLWLVGALQGQNSMYEGFVSLDGEQRWGAASQHGAACQQVQKFLKWLMPQTFVLHYAFAPIGVRLSLVYVC